MTRPTRPRLASPVSLLLPLVVLLGLPTAAFASDRDAAPASDRATDVVRDTAPEAADRVTDEAPETDRPVRDEPLTRRCLEADKVSDW